MPIAICLTVGGVGTAIALLWSLALVAVNHTARPITTEDWGSVATAFVLGAVALWLGWGFIRRPHAITLNRDGTLTFHRVVGTTAINAASIQEIQRSEKLISLDGEDARGAWLWYAGGWVVVPNFPQLEELIEDIVRLNPRISRTGYWPTGN